MSPASIACSAIRNVGHVYEQGKTKDGGWYTEAQATAEGKS
jgi:hypothetical protein